MKRTRLILLVCSGFILYVLLVALLVLMEQDREEATIKSFGDGLWYSVVTLTTVGYGDKAPVTTEGKIIGFVFLLGSLGFLGVLIGNVNETIAERRENKKMGLDGTDFSRHVVIIGWNDFARSITRQLIGAEREVAIITDSKGDIDLIYESFPRTFVFVLFSELNNVGLFTKTNIERSQVVFVNSGNDTDKLIAILNLRKEYPDLQLLVTLDSPDLKDTFRSAGVTYALSKNEIASKLIASYIFEPDVAEFSNDLMSSTDSAGHYDLQQYIVLQKNPYVGRSYGEAFWDLKNTYGSLLLGISKPEGDGRTLHKLPPDDTPISLGDYLIVITDGIGERKLQNLFGTREGIV